MLINQQGIKNFLQSIFATYRELNEAAGCEIPSQGAPFS